MFFVLRQPQEQIERQWSIGPRPIGADPRGHFERRREEEPVPRVGPFGRETVPEARLWLQQRERCRTVGK